MNNSVHFPDHSSLSDQASQLRELVERSRHDGQLRPAPLATAIMVTGGKGGIGKSSLALNLAIALARLGSRICLLDASLGLGHLDLMCGLNGYWNLGHVLAGSRQLSDIMLDGPADIHIVPGAGRLANPDCSSDCVGTDVRRQLATLESEHDVLLFDTGDGFHPFASRCAAAADTVLLVTTPEPTAIAGAYATIKSLPASGEGRLLTLVNRATSAGQAEDIHQRLAKTTRIFLESEPDTAGWIPEDPEMSRAINQQVPLMVQAIESPAAHAIQQLARRLIYQSPPNHQPTSLFEQLWLSSTGPATVDVPKSEISEKNSNSLSQNVDLTRVGAVS